MKLKISHIESQKDRHDEELSSAIKAKSDQCNADQAIVRDVKKKTEDLKLFSDLLSTSIKQIVTDLNIAVDDKDKLEPRMLYFQALEQYLNDNIKSAMDSKLTKDNLAGIKVDETKEGEEEIENNKQMEQTMKILTDSNLNLEDVTTKEDYIKTKQKATLEKKDVESVVEKLKSTKTSMKNLHNE